MRRIQAKSSIIAWSASVTLFAADLATKHFLFEKPQLMKTFGYPGIISLTNHQNTGITFDLALPLPVILAISACVIGFIVRVIVSKKNTLALREAAAYGLILGGAIGNMTDRVWLGYVRDWLLLFGRSAMNLADFAILAGLLLLLTVSRRSPSTTLSGQTA